MIRRFACAFIVLGFCSGQLLAQDSAAPKLGSAGKKKDRASAAKPAAPAKGGDAKKEKGEDADPLKKVLGGDGATPSNQPMTTEIYSEQAYFDSGKSIGIFTGHVIVMDPRFNLQADKLTVYLGKGEVRGLEKAVAEGNVGMVREAPGENGAPPTRSIGRSDTAIYTAGDGNVELHGTPRVQSGINSHIATSPDTVMIINQGGQLNTTGPSRTEIRQEPKNPSPAPPAPPPAAPPTPAPASPPPKKP
jgi:lipopolysaccharide transport protein LptA